VELRDRLWNEDAATTLYEGDVKACQAAVLPRFVSWEVEDGDRGLPVTIVQLPESIHSP
jgi:hypothetical protein